MIQKIIYYYHVIRSIRKDVTHYHIVATGKLQDGSTKGTIVHTKTMLCKKHAKLMKQRLAQHGWTELKRIKKAWSCDDCHRQRIGNL